MAYATRGKYDGILSDECAPNGNGQCDGALYEDGWDGTPCDCICHSSDEIGSTVQQVAKWHADLWATYEPDNPYLPRKIR